MNSATVQVSLFCCTHADILLKELSIHATALTMPEKKHRTGHRQNRMETCIERHNRIVSFIESQKSSIVTVYVWQSLEALSQNQTQWTVGEEVIMAQCQFFLCLFLVTNLLHKIVCISLNYRITHSQVRVSVRSSGKPSCLPSTQLGKTSSNITH